MNQKTIELTLTGGCAIGYTDGTLKHPPALRITTKGNAKSYWTDTGIEYSPKLEAEAVVDALCLALPSGTCDAILEALEARLQPPYGEKS